MARESAPERLREGDRVVVVKKGILGGKRGTLRFVQREPDPAVGDWCGVTDERGGLWPMSSVVLRRDSGGDSEGE